MKLPRGKCASTPVFAPFRGIVKYHPTAIAPWSWEVVGSAAHDYDEKIVIAAGMEFSQHDAFVMCENTASALVSLYYSMVLGVTISPDLEQYNEPKKKKRKGKKK